MFKRASLLEKLLSDLYLKDFRTEVQDNGRLKLGGGFSPLPKAAVNKLRQRVHRLESWTISKV